MTTLEKIINKTLFGVCVIVIVYAVSVGVTSGTPKAATPATQAAHVCEVTLKDLKALMVVIDKKLATRDNIMEGLQRQLYNKQNGVKKK